MEDVSQKLESLELAVRRLETLVEQRLLPECERMGSHISFVERVYAKLRNPLSALRGGAPLPEAPEEMLETMMMPCIEDVD